MTTHKWWLIGAGVVLVIGIGVAGYSVGAHRTKAPVLAKISEKNTSATTPTPKVTSTQNPTSVTTPVVINAYDVAGLFNASYTRALTDFTPWADSPVSKEYRDFNADGVMDVFVWAKLPGTGGYSTAAVWTVEAGAPKELWHLPDSQVLGHSTWSLTSSDGLENKSLNSDGSTDTVNTYHWQVSTTGQGFVLEPSM